MFGGYLRQSTAVTVKTPKFRSSTDLSASTGLTLQKADVRLSKNGGNMAAASADQGASDAGMPHDELGAYDMSFNTTDTNTLGILKADFDESGTVPVEGVWMVLTANAWDSLFGTDLLQVDVREYVGVTGVAGAVPAVAAGANGGLPLGNASGQVAVASFAANAITTAAINDGAITAAKLADNSITAAKIADGAIDAATFAAGAIDAAAIAANAIGAAELAADAASEIATAVRTELATELARVDAAVTTRATPAQVATELGTYDGPTNAEMVARTLAAASYATAAAQTTAQTSLDDIPTNAELAARTLAAADYGTATALATAQTSLNTIDARLDTEIPAMITSLNTLAGYLDTEIAAILADTNELQTDWANGGRLDLLIDGLATSIAGLNNIAAGDVLTQVNAAINAAIPELTGVPSATPTLRTALMLLFMNLRNRTTTTATEETIQNDAGATIAAAALSDDGSTFTKGEFA
jgi:hypothetical protein